MSGLCRRDCVVVLTHLSACVQVLGVKTVQPEQVLQVMQVLLSSFVVSFATEPEAASIKQIAGFSCLLSSRSVCSYVNN
jgi:hypothetical protein